MKLKFLGAAGQVTGSNYLLTSSNDQQVIIDLGLFQGSPETVELNYQPLQFHALDISAVFLTHAHLDHCGRLPLLVFAGFRGRIYMTAPTLELVRLSLEDAARVAKDHSKRPPLYTEEEVIKVLKMVEVIEYDQQFQVGDFLVNYKDAGHILGSASIEIIDTTSPEGLKKITFSGDIGNYPEDLVRPTEFIQNADIVVMETTYGNENHPAENIDEILQQQINAIEQTNGALLIPAFSLERTQELLHRIHHLKKGKLIKEETEVYLDSPLGIRATNVFKEFRKYYNVELLSHEDDPFSFPGLQITEEPKQSKKIKKSQATKVIIAGSGMMSGGRILRHALEYLPKGNTRLLFVGYQAEETLGREILDGARKVEINGEFIKIHAQIEEIETMSSHADQQKLLNWLKQIQAVKKVFLTHGENEAREIFADKVQSNLGITDVVLPGLDQEFVISA